MARTSFDGREESILRKARGLSPAERAAFLDGACGEDFARRQRLETLLAQPAVAASEHTLQSGGANQTPDEASGQIFGRYKLLEKLGEGGFGAVWLAEQKEPVRRKVALKIIKVGMDTRAVVARFEVERQALARMDHPNIAKVLDAGSTESGRPYFVMELVRGIRITDYCDQSQLGTRDRLDLFIQLRQAIQHAHQKGIIHRDIKPSNILVALHDGVPVPKVIDFGIAKATQGELTEMTVHTQFQQFIGTPAYMSPEQAERSGLDIDTRSDIYSLGVLLYELLVGSTPFDAKELMAAGLDELRRTIREKEPLRPSTRLATMRGETLTITAKRRSIESSRLVHQLKGDLDWIVMKCLEKDRSRRYETVNGLAADLRRHLNNEPVTARPPSRAYRLQKAWRRNKLACTAGAAIFAALAIGFTLAAVGRSQARIQRDLALSARAGAEMHRKEAQTSELQAIRERREAELAREETRRRAYAAEINAAFQALAENNLGQALALLDRQLPKSGEADLRGFEWRLLWKRCQSDEKGTFSDAPGAAVTFSPDGRWLASGGDKIVIRELPSRSHVKTIPNVATTLTFSPDGKLLVSADETHVRLWSTTSWEEVRPLPNSRYPAVFSPDGHWLVTGAPKPEGTNGQAGYLVWSTDTWEAPAFCAGEPAWLDQSRQGVAFSRDGKLLVTAGHPLGRDVAQFQVWDFPSLRVRPTFSFVDFKLGCASFSPDGKYLMTGDWTGGLLMVWDIAERRLLQTYHEHTGGILSITCARDGKTFVTSSFDRTLVVWDTETFEVLARLRGHLAKVWSVALSPDGRVLASRSDEGTKLWDPRTRHEMQQFRGFGLINGFSSDGRFALLHGMTNLGLCRFAEDQAQITTTNLGYVFEPGTTTWTSVSGLEPKAVFCQPDGILEQWNLATTRRIASWRADENRVVTVAYSLDGQFIASTGGKGDLKLWNAKTHQEVKRFEPIGQELHYVVFSRDGRLLAGATESRAPGRVFIWEVDGARQPREMAQFNRQVPSVAISPDNQLLATSGDQDAAQLWDIASGKLKATLRGHVQDVMGVAFSPDGKTLVTGGDDQKVELWNVATGQQMVRLEPLRGGCRSALFSPDGRTLAVGGFRDPIPTMSMWQAPSFEEIAAIETEQQLRTAP